MEPNLKSAMLKSAPKYFVTFDRETDGRWIAEVLEFPGVITYGNSKEEAEQAAQKLASEVSVEFYSIR